MYSTRSVLVLPAEAFVQFIAWRPEVTRTGGRVDQNPPHGIPVHGLFPRLAPESAQNGGDSWVRRGLLLVCPEWKLRATLIPRVMRELERRWIDTHETRFSRGFHC